jgi:tetratricopeptide (TPR) repeat protein
VIVDAEDFHRLRDDVYQWTERALAIEAAEDHQLFGRALATLSLGLTSRGDLPRAEATARQALHAAPHDVAAALTAHHALALAALYSGELSGALAAATAQLEIAESADDDMGALVGCTLAALASVYGGAHPAALSWAERSMTLADRSGAPSAKAWASYGLGEVLASTDTEHAATLFEQAITIGETVDNLFVIGVAEVSLTTLHAAVGDPGAALRTFDRLIRHWDGRNDWTHQWTILQNVAPLLTRSGSPVEAAVLVGALTANRAAPPLFGDAADRISRLEADLATRLGLAAFQRHRARGAALSRREIVSFALSLTGRSDCCPDSEIPRQ